MIVSQKTVRVGVLVRRYASEWTPFTYRMFHCRQKDQGDRNLCPVADWAMDEVNLLSVRGGLPGEAKLQVGESRMYWVHMQMTGHRDSWGEYDSDVEILNCRPAGPIRCGS